MQKGTRNSLFIVLFGSFFGVLSSTLMNTALPPIMHVFHISYSSAQWLSNGYMLANALMIPVSAYLMKKFSFKMLFLLFSSFFFIGSLIGAIANQYLLVVLGRMIQAIGAGVMIPLVNVMAMRSTDKKHRGSVMGIIGLVFNFAPIIGPTLSGVVLDSFSWRYLFIMTMPFTLLSIILAVFQLPRITKETDLTFNVKGMVTASFALLCLLWSFSNIGEFNFVSWNILGLLIAGLVFTALFFKTQKGSSNPFVNLNVFKHTQFNIANILNMILMVTMYGNTILLPILIQNVFHKSALISGLVLLPGAMVTGIMSPISGKLFDKYPVRFLVLIGITIDCIGTTLQVLVTPGTSILMITLGQTIRQFGLVLVLIPIQTQALSYLPNEQIPDGVALYNTLRQVAASFGTALLIAIITIADKHSDMGTMSGELVGIKLGFGACLLLLLTCFIFIRKLHTGIEDR
ncbi:DHA2 family efflux MFS transporter permease subunit [Companilactobacillus mishanensis]|uniref:DHA2 family efflux MFS transporter permease subunit n=1 Tax=Companilactobacillus mishanensis TaxID=2486008 RepID=UPI001297BB51|nr:DHA2 family efflux MFS transporter permease subunit [Companilactobacillus mishanensis]MQS88957.1 multidrug efflux MFS transporter [Companilactobacillus mishanensis]